MNTENLRLSIEHSRARFGLTEMVLTCDEVEELCDEIERLRSQRARVTIIGPAWVWGGIEAEGRVTLVFKESNTIGLYGIRWWQLRRWWRMAKSYNANAAIAPRVDARISIKSEVPLTAGAGE